MNRRRQHAAALAAAGTSAADRGSVVTLGAVGLQRPLFLTAIGLSAFLLFTLELLAGRLVLPAFGGSPAVWTTALCFFTGTVFLGYLYAHVVAARLDPRRGGLLHLGLAGVALAATLFAPTELGALRITGLPEALNVLLVLAAIAFAPAFLLSTTSPLLSAWFAGRGGDPWWLYAASNAASLGGLLAYPFLVEPWIPLSLQRIIVAITLAIFAMALGAVVAGGRRNPGRSVAGAAAAKAPPLGRRRQVLWLLAACIPAGLLSATTSFLTTDLVSAPLLWIGPLAIYLGSFVIAFSARGRRLLPAVDRLVPAAATLLWIFYVLRGDWPITLTVLTVLVSYGVLATAIHGRLALDRPDEAHLTRLFVIVSAGGIVATGFVTLIAPLVFSTIYEYPLLLVGGLVVLAALPGSNRPVSRAIGPVVREAAGRVLPYAVVAGLLVAVAFFGNSGMALTIGLTLAVGAMAIAIAWRPTVLAIVTAVVLVEFVVVVSPTPLLRARTFFGVIEIRPAAGGAAFAEYSGTTLHGLQFIDARQGEPTTYYVRSGPLGGAFDDLRARTSNPSIGVVGLGVGTVAAYAVAGDTLTFFEIDQAVIDLAWNTNYFRYLTNSAVSPRIVLGDARLSLAAEPDGSYDLLVLDAFSSDAVPAHLLTSEAIVLYMRKLRPGGVIMFHVSNRYYELDTAVTATAWSLGFRALSLSYLPGSARTEMLEAQTSQWVVVGWDSDTSRFRPRGFTTARFGPVLTDDFSDLLRTLRGP
jgi:hypothetical protein